MRKVLLFIFAVIIFTFNARPTYAQENFLTDYNVSYNVSQNGSTNVNFKITLTNKTENYYASYYKVQLGIRDMKNIKASDGDGLITPDITKDDTGTTIGLALNQRVVGANKKTTFNLSFDTQDIAEVLGRIVEVNIPGLSNQDDFSSFTVNVLTPAQLGPPAYIKPAVINSSSTSLTFSKSDLGKSGVYIAYGDSQIYSFDLSYHLHNDNLFKVKTEIALPPTTNYQNVSINQINPAPSNVRVDEDGNWLAEYVLSGSEKLDVRVTGKARLNLLPKKELLPENLRGEYLKQQPFWQANNSQIKKIAQNLKTPQAIYNYVVQTLTYDFSRVTSNKARLGAEKTLAAPTSAVCLEFTDLFIALARAAGIPAREIEGYAYTQNSRERPLSLVKDILHAWPQYYDDDKQTWIMIDPTWGNTTGGVDYFHTLDFDHLAFVIKGKDSEYPVSAGGYKLPGQEDKKDVLVSVDSTFIESSPILKADLEITKSAFPWAPVVGKIIVKNEGSQISQPQTVKIETNVLKPNNQEVEIGAITPYGSISIPLSFSSPSLLTNKQDQVTITIGQQSFTQKVLISPFNFSKNQLLATGGILVVVFISIISVIAAKLWHLHLSRRKEQNSLRGES